MTQRLNSMEGQRDCRRHYMICFKNPEMFEYSPLEGDPLQSIRPEYIEAFNQKLTENQAKAEEAIETASSRVASMNFALNFPILYGSSLLQFSRSFVKRYDTQRGLETILKRL